MIDFLKTLARCHCADDDQYRAHCVAALNSRNVDYLAKALTTVLQ